MKTSLSIFISIFIAVFVLTSGLIVYIIVLEINQETSGSGDQNIISVANDDRADDGVDISLESTSFENSIPNSEENTSEDSTPSSGEEDTLEDSTPRSDDVNSFEVESAQKADYISERFGIQFTAPNGFQMDSEKISREVFELVGDLYYGDTQYAKYEDDGSFDKMMCSSLSGVTNVNVSVIQLPNGDYSINTLIEEYDIMMNELYSGNCSITSSVEGINIADKRFTSFQGIVDVYDVEDLLYFDVDYLIQDLYVSLHNDLVFFITLTYVEGAADEASALLNAFQPYP